MPLEKFPVADDSKETLRLWSRKLEYLFTHLDSDNVLAATASAITFADSTNNFASVDVEGALEELGRAVLHIEAGTGTLKAWGVSTLTNTTGAGGITKTLLSPIAGVPKTLYCSAASTSDSITVYTGSTACFFGAGTDLRVMFYEAGQVVDLIGLSTSRWMIRGLGSITAAALPTFST